MENLEERLARWRQAGLITASQADSIRAYERSRPRGRAAEAWSMPATRPGPVPLPRPAGRPPAPPTRRAPQRAAPLIHDSGDPLLGGLPFAPPEARLVGLAMMLLALVGVAAGIFSVTLDLLIGPTHNAGGDLEALLHLGASLLGAAGGFRMAMGATSGRRLVLASLGINVAATVVLSFHKLVQGGPILEVLLWIALGAVVAAARFDRSARTVQG